MIKPTSNNAASKTATAPQTAAARAAIAVHVTEVEYDTTNPAWVSFDEQMTAQLDSLEQHFHSLATPLSLAKNPGDKSRR